MTDIETERIVVDPAEPAPATIERAAALLRRGGLVAFPTETVYGLGAAALDAAAVARIFTAKGRPAYDPLIVHLARADELPRVARTVGALAQRLIERFWPGPLTLVLSKAPAVPDVVTAGGPTVAVRCPRHPVARALLDAAALPVAAPSANRFSHASPTTAGHVWDDLAGRIDLILDGGPTPIGVESTVLDVSGAVPRLLRPGGVPLEELRAVLGDVVVAERRPGDPLLSPGLLDRHYAPRAALHLYTGSEADVLAALAAAAADGQQRGMRVGLLLADEDAEHFADPALTVIAVGSRYEPEQVARLLFAALRTLDGAGVGLILARDVPPAGLGLAINDRLRRAAERVIHV